MLLNRVTNAYTNDMCDDMFYHIHAVKRRTHLPAFIIGLGAICVEADNVVAGLF